MAWVGKTVLVTGGTGSFGSRFAAHALRHLKPRKIIIFSRDELKQYELRTGGLDDPRLRWFLGDVRDLDRLRRAFQGVDIVIHAAALKQVPACEYNPIEAVNTNINGTRNVIEAALDCGVQKVMLVSTDKACAPVNLYGATKMAAEKLIVQSNSYTGDKGTRFSVVRYGNVVGSRGSVVPLFLNQRNNGKLTITDDRMTRFWITLDQAVRFVETCIDQMSGGEIFVPKIPSATILDLAAALAPGCKLETVGIRPGEKLHETMVTEDESRHCLDLGDRFLLKPLFPWWSEGDIVNANGHEPVAVPPGFVYSSGTNHHFLTVDEIRALLGELRLLQAA
ncbi:UDP-N-acetylglucosamine 4,6-dehydratase (inverting) [Desertibaculum subflavum]|uniref:UDP-N-acetylglucosamine 4,6-dehydratase (inverting) n=1 Tax=Desertibaculum subflavum TaxID=2268458 RepID=UPI000E6638F1